MPDDALFPDEEREVVPPAPRKRDYSFEALVEVTGAELGSLTENERGRINAALKELRHVEPDDYLLADMIHERAKAWDVAYPQIPLTPQALTGSWTSIEQKAADTRRQETLAYNAPASPQSVSCETCNGDRMVLVAIRPSATNPTSGFDEMAPCPDCNSGADADFWRADGSRFSTPSPEIVRMKMRP